jgi:hypothetical protein
VGGEEKSIERGIKGKRERKKEIVQMARRRPT